MKNQNTQNKENLVMGILAHVDAGKTTLIESLLAFTGAIKKAGRVDHGSAFLDTDSQERQRGITIYSKIALMTTKNFNITILDTPGHSDFSCEMERTLSVLDFACLIVSALDGITGQLISIWNLLRTYNIPLMIFVNKMDQAGSDKDSAMKEIVSRLSSSCLAFQADVNSDSLQEELSLLDEELLEKYLSGSPIERTDISKLIMGRKLFPVLFGSALHSQGIDNLVSIIDSYVTPNTPGPEFSASVYKISRENGLRLSWMRIFGGSLKIRDEINGSKIGEIRLYNGKKYSLISEAGAGQIVACPGIPGLKAGDSLGALSNNKPSSPLIMPTETTEILLPEGYDVHAAFLQISEIGEEEPSLSVSHETDTNKIYVSMMGQIQGEILKNTLLERFNLSVSFGPPKVIFLETIKSPVIGVGHFEPLRHYSEVQLLIEPAERNSGITIDSICPTDLLSLSWQKQIISSLLSYPHRGVLTGSRLTDVKITLLSGKAHIKHTEGGDFREAALRAVRQGLMQAENILLEPFVSAAISLPTSFLGRVMSDLSQMGAEISPPEIFGDKAEIKAAISQTAFSGYEKIFTGYTSGHGTITKNFSGYSPSPNPDKIILESNYDPERDLSNPSYSVFCMHGAGTVVPWDKVFDYMHLPLFTDSAKNNQDILFDPIDDLINTKGYNLSETHEIPEERTFKEIESERRAFDQELKDIFERTYGPIKPEERTDKQKKKPPKKIDGSDYVPPKTPKSKKSNTKEYLLVDGYNIIFAWEYLRQLAMDDIKAARDRLMDDLSEYSHISGKAIILVFDAYKVNGGKEKIMKYGSIDVVFTKEAETADLYIEKTTHSLKKKTDKISVASGDGLIQLIILSSGAIRVTPMGLYDAMMREKDELLNSI